jgi:HemY protein
MRRLFWIVLTIALAVAVALVIERFPGNVLVVVDQWRLQVSLSFAILALLALFVSAYVSIRLVVWLTDLPTRYRGWRGQRAERRDQSRMEQGWIALLEGRHAFAEKLLTRVSADSKDWKRQVLADLSAARAAQEIGAFDRRDHLIQKAQTLVVKDGEQSNMAVAVAAAAADLWLDQGQAKAALEVLDRAGVKERKDVHTLRLLLRTHQQLNNNEQVLDLARRLRRQQAISTEQADGLIEAAAAYLIKAKSLLADSAEWESFWKSLRAEEKVLVSVALAGSDAYQARGKLKEASKVLEVAIKESFDPRLLQAYAKAEAEQVTSRLQNAERWLTQRENDPNLLVTLGALCLAAQMWGQAQRYLEQSAQLRSDSHVNALLGSLFDRLGQPERAAQHWRMATAVSAALPTLAQDVFLPAADIQSDPVFTLTEAFVDDPLTPIDTSAKGLTRGHPNIDAASGASMPSRLKQQDYDELFDSAPLPAHAFESADSQSNEKKQ